MPLKRVILALGTGNDLHGGDYTKSAIRAAFDARPHSSLGITRAIGADPAAPPGEVSARLQPPDRGGQCGPRGRRLRQRGQTADPVVGAARSNGPRWRILRTAGRCRRRMCLVG